MKTSSEKLKTYGGSEISVTLFPENFHPFWPLWYIKHRPQMQTFRHVYTLKILINKSYKKKPSLDLSVEVLCSQLNFWPMKRERNHRIRLYILKPMYLQIALLEGKMQCIFLVKLNLLQMGLFFELRQNHNQIIMVIRINKFR